MGVINQKYGHEFVKTNFNAGAFIFLSNDR
jgi:hypothetical protein